MPGKMSIVRAFGEEPARFDERHFLAGELAELWHVSRATVARWAMDEPDVLRVPIGIRARAAADGKPRKRAHLFMLRIPESVARRMWEKRLGRRK